MLIHFGCTPYLIFDGDHLPSKKGTEESRGQRRRDSKTTGLELLRLGKTQQAQQELQKAVDVTPEMARQLIDELKRNHIQYVVAPYEADSQLAYLERQQKIDAILSEDSDLLVFGAKCLLTKLDQYGSCIMIKRDDFTACSDINLNGWTNDDFRCMAILSGCDYLDGIHKMGLKTAYRYIRKYKTIQRIIQGAQLEGKLRIPPGYFENFMQADMTFRYQYVFCPEARCLVNLTKPDTDDQLNGLTYIGKYVEPEIARRVASGELNPMTKQIIISEVMPGRFQRTPLGARNSTTAKATPDDSVKCKKIDSFFKPRRTPLAELDPNTFTPSPSQQRLLRENSSREWASAPVPRTSTSALRPALINIPRPQKRPRLCDEPVSSPCPTPSEQPEQSPFFKSTSSAPQPGLTRRDNPESLWSDDSLDNALVTLAEPPSSMPAPKKSKFTVFADDRPSTQDVNLSMCSTLVASDDEPVDDDDNDNNKSRPSIFAKYVLEQTQSFTSRYSHEPPDTQESRGTASQARSEGEPQAVMTTQAGIPTTTMTEAKGSEDMLLVPESDAESIPDSDFNPREGEGEEDEGLCVPASSPLRGDGRGADGGEEDDDDDEGDDGSGYRRRTMTTLDLGRFAFGRVG